MKDAGITSKQEMITRLLNGEVFYYNSSKIEFDEDHPNGPFLVDGETMAQSTFGFFDDMLKESHWWEDIPDTGRLCWVWDNIVNKGKTPGLVVQYTGAKWVTADGSLYMNATPILSEDL